MKRSPKALRIHPSIVIAVVCVFYFLAAQSRANTLILPNYAATNQIDNNAEALFTSVLREQAVYGASEFPLYPIVITEIRWRPDTFAGGPITTTISNIQVNLSTTAANPDQLNSVFGQNTGTNNTAVFSGAMHVTSSYTTLPNGTKAFDISLPLQTPFLFDPAQGNLLLDIRNFTGCSASLYNNSTGNGADAVSRIYNTSDANATSSSGGDSGGGVVQIVYSVAATAPAITGQPTNRTVSVGDSTTFTVKVTGAPPLSYQWFFNDTNSPLNGATNSTLTLANVQTNQAGNYLVQVTDPYGPTLSSNALLTVVFLPVITSQPVSQTVAAGSTATFTLAASSGVPLSFQWFFNNANLISGATNTSLTVSNVQSLQVGIYSVLVTNSYGSVNSSNAALTLGLIVPGYETTNQAANNGEAIFPSILREQAVYASSEFPTYPIVISEIRWRPDTFAGGPITTTISNIQINLSTTQAKPDQLNSTFSQNTGPDDTVAFAGVMHASTSFTTLSNGTTAFDINLPLQTPFTFDPSKGNLLLDLRNFTGCSATLYNNSVPNAVDAVSRIYNTSSASATSASGGDSGGGVLQLIYTAAQGTPGVAVQPTNRTVTVNGTATFTAIGSGPPPLNYQWFFNNTNTMVLGATNSTLTLVNVQTNQAGNYFVQVSNAFGTAFSSSALLTITTLPIITAQPANQTVALGGTAIFSVTVNSGVPLTYQWFFNDTNAVPGATNVSLVLTNVQMPQLGNYSVQVTNVYGSARSLNASLTLGVVVPNSATNSQTGNSGESMFANISREQAVYNASQFPAFPILISEIHWRPDSVSGGPITITISNIQVNLSTTVNTADHLSTTFAQNTGTNDTVVFSGAMNVATSFTNLSNGTKAFDIGLPLQTPFVFDPSKGNLLIDVRNFTGCSATLYDNAASSSGDAVSRVFNTSNPNAATSSVTDTGAGVMQLIYTPAPVPPTITSQPTNQTVVVGGTAMFAVAASGFAPFSYQWFFNDTNSPVIGATNSALTLANVQTNQGGNYFVRVTGPLASILSSNALLTATLDPIIASQPASQTAAAGTSATFTVVASSSTPITYQWFFNNTNLIADATNASLTVTNIQLPLVGIYSVQVINSYSSVNSSNATLNLGLIVPNYEASSQTANSGESIFPSILREQAVYGASEFPAYPIVISEIRWRPDTFAGGPITTVISNIQINLSTTTNTADHLSSTFAQNTGTNDTVVFSGAMHVVSSFTTLTNGTKAFDINLPLQTPFIFDPSKGNLLVDLRNFTGCNATLYNNSVPNAVDTVSRIYNTSSAGATTSSGGDSGGGVMQLAYVPAPVPPTISGQPTNSTVTVGVKVTFAVTAGPLPLSYQWFFNTNTIISGATNGSLVLSNVQPGQAGSYLVQVMNPYGPTLSSNAVLTVTTNAPILMSQPANQTGIVGSNITFNVSATGSLPLTYQWLFNTNSLLTGATNSSLVLTNVQIGQAGTYGVLVSNAYGSTNSTNVLLTVTFPPATIRFGATNIMGGNSFDLPVFLVANGNENTLSFSMNFPTQRMTYASIVLGSGASDAGFLPNTSQAVSGRIGVTLQLPGGVTFAPGTQEVVRVTFNSAILTGAAQPVSAPINFTNQPINKLLFDAQNNKLATNFVNSSILISNTIFEADVTPRTGGDGNLDIFDWSQVGRFVAGLDVVSNASEFQRVDCAPKSTAGDGQLKVTDWVQAGRYGAAVDAPAAVGGPTAPVAPTVLTGGPRTVNIAGGTSVKGLTFTVPVTLQSQGNENGVGFSVNFDPTILKYSSAAKGGAAASATMNVNTNQVASGHVGVLLALTAGNNFATGPQEIVKLNFTALNSATNNAVAFSGQPVLLAISDPSANELSANYTNSAVIINPPPNLVITLTNGNATLSWPTWATGFNLQSTIALLPSSWTNVPTTTQTNGSDVSVTVPVPDEGSYFRLQHP